MQTITKQITTSLPYQFLPSKSIHNEDILLFDIETTGFSPDTTSIYLIGCCYYNSTQKISSTNHSLHGWQMIQWFADDYISEQLMLENFTQFTKDFKILIHFNGFGFDIPYIQKKLIYYNINFNFDSFLHIDLYKKIFPYKKLLQLPNLKQKTIETFLGLPRNDKYSGGELIHVYVNYMKHKFSHNIEMKKEYKELLLHNEEDVSNLIQLTSILSYCDLFEEEPILKDICMEQKHITITCSLRNTINHSISFEVNQISLHAVGAVATLQIPYYQSELKYFYPNYKDYYYLTLEDTAIHKSVAEFVDKEYRVKAKASTCYTKKNGTFLPQFSGSLEPSFRMEYKDKESYIEVSKELLSNRDMMREYVASLLKYILFLVSKGK